jgi:D-aminopeptidase
MVRSGGESLSYFHKGNLYEEKLKAGVHVQNGAGELTGALQVMEWGIIETPLALANTLNVGLMHDAIVEYVLERDPDIGDHDERARRQCLTRSAYR